MSDKLPSQPAGPPTVFADNGSIVSKRELNDLKGGSLLMHYTVGDAGAGPSENAAGQAPQAQYTATGGSAICADNMSNVHVNDVIDLSVTMNSSRAGRAKEAPPTYEGPAVKMIIKHKVKLIEYLMADHSFILQHVHSKEIVTQKQYTNMKNISQPEETITNLIDRVISNGQESCSRFIEVLKEADVVANYPQLKKIPWC